MWNEDMMAMFQSKVNTYICLMAPTNLEPNSVLRHNSTQEAITQLELHLFSSKKKKGGGGGKKKTVVSNAG